ANPPDTTNGNLQSVRMKHMQRDRAAPEVERRVVLQRDSVGRIRDAGPATIDHRLDLATRELDAAARRIHQHDDVGPLLRRGRRTREPTATNSASRTNQTCCVYLMSAFLLEEDPRVCSRSSSLACLLARGALRRVHLLLELGLERF